MQILSNFNLTPHSTLVNVHTIDEAIRLLKQGVVPKTNENRLRLCAHILLQEFKADDEEKIQLLRQLVPELTALNLDLDGRESGHIRPVYSDQAQSKIPDGHIKVTRDQMYLLLSAVTRHFGWSGFEPDRSKTGAILLLEILTELRMDMICFTNRNGISSQLSFKASEAPLNVLPFAKLRTCNLRIIGLPVEENDHLLKLLNDTTMLTSLNFENHSFRKTDKFSLTQVMLNNPSIQTLVLTGNLIPKSESDEIVKSIMQLPHLKKLHLSRNSIFDEAAIDGCYEYSLTIFIPAIFKMTALTTLKICHPELGNWINTDDGIEFLKKLKANNSLRSVELISDKKVNLEPSTQQALRNVLKCNATLIQFSVVGVAWGSGDIDAIDWLAGNQAVLNLDSQPQMVSEDLWMCAPQLPTELIQMLERYRLWQGYRSDLEKAALKRL